MIYAEYRDADGRVHSGVYRHCEQYVKATFSPLSEDVLIVDLKAHGKTYAEKKASVREQAVDIQCGTHEGLHWSDAALISAYFKKMGKRYGLTDEFLENGVI